MVEEIRLLASLQHPNIISYFEAFCDHDRLCVVTELVMGGDLGSYIRCGLVFHCTAYNSQQAF